jgi:hypothetical protein
MCFVNMIQNFAGLRTVHVPLVTINVQLPSRQLIREKYSIPLSMNRALKAQAL